MKLKINPSLGILETYSVYDPAIDVANSNLELFQKTRDTSHLKFLPGSTPTKFYLRDIPSMIFVDRITSSTNINFQLIAAFAFGIEKIQNLQPFCINKDVEIENDGLTTWIPDEEIDVLNKGKMKHIKVEDVINYFNMQLVAELGSIVLKKTQLMNGQKAEYPIMRI